MRITRRIQHKKLEDVKFEELSILYLNVISQHGSGDFSVARGRSSNSSAMYCSKQKINGTS